MLAKESSGGFRFGKCPTFVIKYEGTSQLWIISEGMRSISQRMRVGTPMAPLPHVIWRPPTVLGRPTAHITT